MLTAELTGRNSDFGLAKNTDDLFVGKTLLHGDVLMWLMKTLLTSRCVNQRGAGQTDQKQEAVEVMCEASDSLNHTNFQSTKAYLKLSAKSAGIAVSHIEI